MHAPQDLSLKNQLVAALPPLERGLLLEHSELVELPLRAVLLRQGDRSDFAYFPIDCLVSNVLSMACVPDMEVSMVGVEGMVNTSMVLGLAWVPYTSLVQGAGSALKIHHDALRLRRAEDTFLRTVLLRYIGIVDCQMAQRVLCVNYHSVQQRLARTLLMARDRSHSSELFVTHEALALMLGVRRESISGAARQLQTLGLISYRRGYVMLLDGEALEAQACACYRIDQASYRELQPVAPQAPPALPLFSTSAVTDPERRAKRPH